MDRWIRARNSLLERLTSGRFGVSSGCHARSPESPWKTDYVESFNGRLRDECLNEHWFVSLAHAKVEIERWRREYNEERPKKAWAG